MVTTGALIHGDSNRFLTYHQSEHPLALQLGGSNPAELALCAKMAEDWGYDEVNLNVGCPSDRVQNNMIGACLMGHPELVAQCVNEMQNATRLPITVKHRIGIDDQDSYEHMTNFVNIVRKTGCKTFIVHARKAVLQGLSPKQNRDVPPLIYPYVYDLKKEFPELEILINGGIKTIDDCITHLEKVDGVMVGREAYHNPWMLSHVDNLIFGKESHSQLSRHDVVEAFLPYIEQELSKGTYLGHITRHILGIFHAEKGGKRFRRHLSENSHMPGAGVSVVEDALALVPR